MAKQIRVFISYARDDAAFVDRLTKALAERGIDAWVDRREIAPAADWLRRIVDGIVKATFFIFVVSPRSVTSEVCAVELRQAVGLNKPLVPVLWSAATMPEAMASLQWSDFSHEEQFQGSITQLEAALRRDPEWLADHARLAASAADWDARGRPRFSLLHGTDIKIAERWLSNANTTRPKPTSLQEAYIRASRRFAREWKLGAVVATIALLAIASVAVLLRQHSAKEARARDLASRAVQLRSTDQAGLTASTLMLVEAVRELSDVGVRSPDIEAMLHSEMSMLLRPLGEGIHPNGVGGMAVAPNGKLIATFAFGLNADVEAEWNGGPGDKTVRLWDVPSDGPAAVLDHESPVGAAAFDGTGRLITGTINGSVAFWNVDRARSGAAQPLQKYDEGAIVSSIAGSVSQAIAVTADASGRICVWDTSTGTLKWCQNAASVDGRIIVAISPDDKLVASGDGAGNIQIWSTVDGKPVQSMHHTSKGGITALAFSPASNQIATGDDKGEMHAWSLPDGSDKFSVLHRDGVTDLAYTPAEAKAVFIATVSRDRSLRIIEQMAFGPWRLSEYRFDYALWHVAVSPDGRLAAVARGDGFVDFWDQKSGNIIGRMRSSTGNVATGLALLPNDALAMVDGGQGVQFATVTAGNDSELLNAHDKVDKMMLSSSGLLLASISGNEGRSWELSGTSARPASVGIASFGQAAFSPAADRVSLIDDDAKVLRIVSIPDGNELIKWPVPDNIAAVAWNPKQNLIAVAKGDGGTWLYDAGTGREVARASAGGSGLSFSPDGSRLAMVVPDEGLRIWDWSSGLEPWALDGNGDIVSASFMSPERIIIVSKERVRGMRLLSSAKQGDPLQQVWQADLCESDEYPLAQSSDGALIAIACEDGRIRVWNALTGNIVADLRYQGQPKALALTPDRRVLIVGGDRGLLSFLLTSDDLVAEACARLKSNFSKADWARYIGPGYRCVCAGKPGCD